MLFVIKNQREMGKDKRPFCQKTHNHTLFNFHNRLHKFTQLVALFRVNSRKFIANFYQIYCSAKLDGNGS